MEAEGQTIHTVVPIAPVNLGREGATEQSRGGTSTVSSVNTTSKVSGWTAYPL